MQEQKSMMLFTDNYQGYPTFGAFPTTKDSPFLKFLYDPTTKGMAIIGCQLKQDYNLYEKLDTNGYPEEVTGNKAKELRKKYPHLPPFKKERLVADAPNEYLIVDPQEQEKIVRQFCINADNFDFMKYVAAPPVKAELDPVEGSEISPETQMKSIVPEGLSVVKE